MSTNIGRDAGFDHQVLLLSFKIENGLQCCWTCTYWLLANKCKPITTANISEKVWAWKKIAGKVCVLFERLNSPQFALIVQKLYSVRMLGGASPPEWVRKAWGSFLNSSKKTNEGWWGGPEKQCSLEIKRQTRYVLLLNATEIGKTFPVISCLCFLLHCTCMGQNGALVTAFMNTKLLFVNFFGRRRPSNFLPSATTPSGHLRLDARTKKEHSTLRKHKLWEERLGAKTVAQREEETVWHARKRLYYWYVDRRVPMQYPGVSQKYKKKQMEKKLYREQIIKAEIDCFSTNRSIYRWIVAAGRPVVQRPSN